MLNSDQFQNVAANLKRFSGTPIDLWQISDPEATAAATPPRRRWPDPCKLPACPRLKKAISVERW
jgi:hypothetical protein